MDCKDEFYQQVQHRLTNGDDPQLRVFTKCIKWKEVKGSAGQGGLGYVFVKIGQPEKAKELHTVLLKEISDESDEAHYYHQLGCLKSSQGNYVRAMQYFETEHKMREEIFPFNHRSLAASYHNNIGQVHGSTEGSLLESV